MQVTIRVFHEFSPDFPNPNKPLGEYTLEAADYLEFEKEYQEARQVWGEYQVEAFTKGMHRGESQTYQEQLLTELSVA